MESQYASQFEELGREHREVQDEKKAITVEYAQLSEETSPEKRENVREQMILLNKVELAQREKARLFIEESDKDVETNDKDYVFIHFILTYLPRGLVGLLLAVILSAAMSSTASELNALGSTTAVDLYKRNVPDKTEDHYVKASKWFTLIWGIIAIMVASVADLFDNLIQLVNIIGSIFYGNVLGIFLLAFFIKFVRSNAVFYAALITQVVVIIVWAMEIMPYLWLNVLGCAVVMLLAIFLNQFFKSEKLEV